MLSSTTQLAVLLSTLLSPLVVASAVPAQPLTPRIPKTGIGSTHLYKKPTDDTSCRNGPTSRGCWEGDFNIDTDMDLHWPDTGRTVKVSTLDQVTIVLYIDHFQYELEITNTTGAPDGFERSMFLVNGQYPGPVRTTTHKIWANADTLQTLVANWGDNLEISVTNSLQHNGTGLHWHGMRQLGSNQEDGVNGITECPIAPGDTRVYRFKATQYGASVSWAV